jgi:hypothetical protein
MIVLILTPERPQLLQCAEALASMAIARKGQVVLSVTFLSVLTLAIPADVRSRGAKLPHRERASVLRNRTNADGEPLGDISSDDEAADSDDVDSDEVAEFIDADSDVSDFEEQKDFLSI